MVKKSEQDLYDLLSRLDCLEKENTQLKKLLKAKRYRFIDNIVDSLYKLTFPKKETKNKHEVKKLGEIVKSEPTEIGRTVEKGRIDIINMNFYDWNGKVLYKGGAERYIYDLASLLKDMGYKPRILQGANEPFKKTYRGIKVIGVKSNKQEIWRLSKIYNYYCQGAELVIASPLELASEIKGVPIISINHGINFDTPWNTFDSVVENQYVDYKKGLKNSSTCVCVDTNFINWVRTRDYDESMKLQYIPNYYDETIFKPVKKNLHKKLIFTYPRRLYAARGADITIEAFDKILEKYPDKVKLQFVGQINDEETTEQLKYLTEKYPDKVSHIEYKMKDMHKAYDNSDVAIIPTRYSEGTSLSCIEAMASGVAIIATNVGGLPNLIINEFNGFLISPSAEDLEKAVIKLIKNPKLIEKFAKNGNEVVKASFTKTLWDQRWEKIINEVLKLK